MEKRIKYALYKRQYSALETISGSYDPLTKTIIVIMPDEKRVTWPDQFKATGGNARRLDGYRINIQIWGTGVAATYRIEASSDGYGRNVPFYQRIPGTGNEAKRAAIEAALELAKTDYYKEEA